MKKFTVSLIAFAVIALFSCSSDDNEDTQEDMVVPLQGTISVALSNGAGYVAENIEAFVEKKYDASNTNIMNVSALVNGGNLFISIVDQDSTMPAVSNNNTISVGDTSQSSYVTVMYLSDDFSLEATAGSFEIITYDQDEYTSYVVLNATFSAAEGNNTMVSSINDLVLVCSVCN